MFKDVFHFLLFFVLVINALLFVPQLIKIKKEKSAKGVSLLTFLGLMFIQIVMIYYGFFSQNYLLVFGCLPSTLACGSVIVLICFFNKKNEDIYTLSEYEILNQLPCNVYWKDLQGLFVGSNKSNLKDFKFKSLADYKDKSDYDIFSEVEAKKIRLNDDKVIKTCSNLIVEEEVSTSMGKRTYLSHKVPLKAKNNKLVGVLGVSVDITEKNNEVVDKLEMLENIIAVMPGNVYWLNKDGVYLGCNNNQANHIGLLSRKNIVGKKNIEIPEFLIPDVCEKNNQKVLESGLSITVEEPAVLSDGSEAVVLSSKVPLRNSHGEVTGIVGISIDITEKNRQERELVAAKEEAEKYNKIKSEFISNMEHDIRTPFIGIYGMLDILADREVDVEKKTILNEVSGCAKELMGYFDDILDFSKIESDFFSSVAECFVLKSLIDSVVTIESIAAKNKHLDLFIKLDDSLPKAVIGDSYRIKRILINLLSNAIKFTQSGYVKLSVGLEEAQGTGKRNILVKFIVEDSGIGIPEDKKMLIYERFTRVIPSNTGLYKGLGLGLRVIKQFVDEMGGDIHLKSEVGKGSTFYIFLPLRVPLSEKIITE